MSSLSALLKSYTSSTTKIVLNNSRLRRVVLVRFYRLTIQENMLAYFT